MRTVDLLHDMSKAKDLTYFNDPSITEFFTVTEKQFKFLWGILSCEFMNADPNFGASVTDDNGDVWGLNWNNFKWNVPHYIPNRSKYGRTFYIHFHKKTKP